MVNLASLQRLAKFGATFDVSAMIPRRRRTGLGRGGAFEVLAPDPDHSRPRGQGDPARYEPSFVRANSEHRTAHVRPLRTLDTNRAYRAVQHARHRFSEELTASSLQPLRAAGESRPQASDPGRPKLPQRPSRRLEVSFRRFVLNRQSFQPLGGTKQMVEAFSLCANTRSENRDKA
jgi:hypothetical protein